MASKKKNSNSDSDNDNSGNGFPIELTKGYIKEQILASYEYAAESLCTIANGQTRQEKNYEKTGTPSDERNGTGFMSSHAVRGLALATSIQSGEKLSTEERAEVQQMASHYTKQLARHARDTAPAAVRKKLAPFFMTEKAEKPAKTARKAKTTSRKTKPAQAERRARRPRKTEAA